MPSLTRLSSSPSNVENFDRGKNQADDDGLVCRAKLFSVDLNYLRMPVNSPDAREMSPDAQVPSVPSSCGMQIQVVHIYNVDRNAKCVAEAGTHCIGICYHEFHAQATIPKKHFGVIQYARKHILQATPT
ncbi:unnamed protein product [Scytosiphon promiscuus]